MTTEHGDGPGAVPEVTAGVTAVPEVTAGVTAAPEVTAATPDIDAFTRPYWDAAADGRLLIRRCRACTRVHHYPREFCPHCWSDDVDWEPTSGRATLYTWSVVHRNDLPPFGARVPYVAAVVDLAEGPRMMTEIVECAEGELAVGMAVEVTFRMDGRIAVPVFRIAR